MQSLCINKSFHFGAGAMLISIFVIIAGCASSRLPLPPAIDAGSSLQINLSLDGLPNASHVYLQAGRVMPGKALDRWSTYCDLFVYNPAENAYYQTRIQPGLFRILDVSNGREVVDASDNPNRPWRVASLLWQGRDLASYILYQTQLRLQSQLQPDVHSLSCSVKAGTYGPYYPSLQQTRAALGKLIELKTSQI